MSCFCNLHTHSMFSLLDSISKPEDIVNKVKSMKQDAVAITEHGNVFSSVKMFKLCKENNIKFIYGCEFYICENRFEKNKESKYNHITVLAENEQGRLNINKLVSLGYLEGFYYKPRIDFELLKQHKEGLIILSGCMASQLQRTLITQGYERAKEVVQKFKQTFGKNYYLEIQSHRDLTQQKLNRQIVDLAKEFGIEYVVTADSHFINEEDHELHSIFVQIGQEREAGETYADTQLQSEEEVWQRLISLTNEEKEEAIKTTQIIKDRCANNIIPLSAPIIPHVPIPNEFANEVEYLKHLCNEGWKKREINKLPKEKQKIYKERLYYEFNAVKEMGFEGYFLLVQSYANTVKRRGIARGSGGGSLIAYLLNIVDIDPIKYGLYFERFIDVSALDLLKEGKIKPEELKIPDIDLDFGREDREKVIKFIEQTYGKDKFACLGSFQYIWDKSAIKDVGRILGIPFEVTNEITKKLGDEEIDEAINNGTLNEYIEKYPKLFDYAKKLTGLPRQFSMHPCGRIVSTKELTYFTGILQNEDEIVLQCDMEDAESLGLVKIDALGLRTVDVIYDVLDMIGKDYEYINPAKINLQDEKVYEIFRNGMTNGIFQFESEGMKKTLIKMKPTTLDDLAVANALYRPGSMKYIDNYIKRKHGEEKFEYLHPDLEPILNSTYGIIVFQEQLIEIGKIANLRNPDEIRKACAKKIPEKMAKLEPELKSGLLNRGWSQEQVNRLWDDIIEFTRYSFNKSHSYAYALIAYITAFLKVYHPTEYVCAMFNSFEGKNEKFGLCWEEAKRLNVKIEPFDYKNTSPLCKVVNNKIIIGTSMIKECNRQLAYDLTKVSQNKYKYFVELLAAIINNTSIQSNQIEILIKLGFFSEFGNSGKLYMIYQEFKNGKNRYKKDHKQETKEKRLKELIDFEQNLENKKMNLIESLKFEKQFLGSIVSVFPNLKSDYSLVLNIDDKYSPKIELYDLKTGEIKLLKIDKKNYYDEGKVPKFKVGDILKNIKIEKRKKIIPQNGKWTKLDEEEEWIVGCSIIKQ